MDKGEPLILSFPLPPSSCNQYSQQWIFLQTLFLFFIHKYFCIQESSTEILSKPIYYSPTFFLLVRFHGHHWKTVNRDLMIFIFWQYIYKCNRIPWDMIGFGKSTFIYFSSSSFYPTFLTWILLQPLRECILTLWCATFLIWLYRYLFTIAKLETYSYYMQSSVWGLSILFHLHIYLWLLQYHFIIIITALK